MTDSEKLTRLQTLLRTNADDVSENARLMGYLNMAKDEILNWLYVNVGAVPSTVVAVPARYEQVQIQACITGFNISGAENQTTHNENGISRTFRYSDMLEYIHSHVVPYIGVPTGE